MALNRWLLLSLALLVVASACASSNADDTAAPTTVPATALPTTTSSSTSTTTNVPSTTTTTGPTPTIPALGAGSRGPDVLALETKLAAMRYEVGVADEVWDGATTQAVYAFQKVNDLPRTGSVTAEVGEAIRAASEPPAMFAEGGRTRVEIDLRRQVLFLWRDGSLQRIIAVSTGSGKRYCVDGDCDTAITPGGSFKVGRKIKGLRVSRLGKLYNPLYFNGGIAIHGSPSVPPTPASHGCVRLPMHVSPWFFNEVAIGTPVHVLGGNRAPVPFNEQAPGADPNASSTTTTAAPSSTSTTTTSAPPTPSTTTPPATTTTTTVPPATPPTTAR